MQIYEIQSEFVSMYEVRINNMIADFFKLFLKCTINYFINYNFCYSHKNVTNSRNFHRFHTYSYLLKEQQRIG